MEQVEVYVVEPEAGQGVVEVTRDIEGGHPLAVLVVVGALADYYDLLAQAAVPYPPAEGPLAVASAVLVGRIERGAALGEDLIEEREAPFLLPSSSERIITVPCTIRATGLSTPGTRP